MNILAFDTSSDHCAVALLCQGELPVFDVALTQQGHAEILVPKIQSLLQRAKLTFQDIGLIAVGAGPGSFTGIRVTLATARGLALAGNIPVVGVNSFEVFSEAAIPQLKDERQFYVVLDARRRDLFYQAYGAKEKLNSEPKMAMPQELLQLLSHQPSLVVGTGVQRLQKLAQSGEEVSFCNFIDISSEIFLEVLAKKAAVVFQNGVAPVSCQPYYLVPPGITCAVKV